MSSSTNLEKNPEAESYSLAPNLEQKLDNVFSCLSEWSYWYSIDYLFM